MVVLGHFNKLDWKYHSLQNTFMTRLLDSIKKSPYISTIEGSLIDIFLGLLFNVDEAGPGLTQTINKTQSVFETIARSHSGQPIEEFKLRPSGTTYIVNYLKMLMESSRINTSTFFSTEVRSSQQRIVVSLVRRMCHKVDNSDEQKDLVIKTLVVILDRLIDSSPQVIPYFIESYLREFQLRLDDPSQAMLQFEELQKKFAISLNSHNIFPSK